MSGTLADKYDFKVAEADCQESWKRLNTYAWDAAAPKSESYIIDTPPPTVSGYLHMGHIYSYTQTDLTARYMRMAGRNVFYPIGFDDNGLPTERLVEATRKIRATDMSREEFVAICHEVVQQSEEDFRKLFRSIGLSVDWAQEYQTISPTSMKLSQMSALDLFKKGHLYRTWQPTLWDPVDRTALAQAEVVDKEVASSMWELAFGLEGGGEVVIATTRPELLGACCALFIHPDHPKAAGLLGRNAISPLFQVPVPILADERADPEKGTGIVMCCTFGDTTDIEWWREHKLPTRVILDKNGRLTGLERIGGSADWPSLDRDSAQAAAAELTGLKVNAARTKTIELLTARDVVRGSTAVNRMVPSAERSGAPLEILVTPQWFVRVLDKKDDLLKIGSEIAWYPPYMQVRYDRWVENLKWDWCISRQRYFGVPFPFWYSKRPGEEGKVLFADVADLPVNPLTDLPRGYTADEVEPDPDVMDTWATSSVSPQLNSRAVAPGFEVDSERHDKLFPADMRPQAHEIIRTWAFYTIVKSYLHEGKAPWKDITISGWCLAQDRSKMSKSKGNVVTPDSLLERYGADVVRYWTATSRLGLDTALSEDVLKVGKRLTTKLWNATRFVSMQLKDFDGAPSTPKEDVAKGIIVSPVDQWILTRLSEVVRGSGELFGKYEYADALHLIERFFWNDFCDNYLELSKGRAYSDVGNEAEHRSAQYTLWHCLETMLRLFAPTLPYMTETLYQGLFPGRSSSIHNRGNWPKADDQFASASAELAGEACVGILAAVRKAKSDRQVSLKTPLAWLRVAPGATPPDGARELVASITGDLAATIGASVVEWADSLEGETVPTQDSAFALQLEFAAPAQE
ncbi:valine--tRNA ligase [Azospirillum agricola]|uniref:valine--tRNA ligase n=1 Tax=Azospirillum agricola TaxID=1720247 RepID=UPI000A0F0867|nr:valine--tRNA ligase [Azospirillum agricola]SMH29882.1 valyl-tRNA synthetase [Azospirillum lipoferum]